jgi:hypothetical protein
MDANTRWGVVSSYFSMDDYNLDNPYPTGQGGANVPGFSAISLGRAQLLSLSDTKTLGWNAVNELHFSYLRFANNVGQPVDGFGPKLSQQGFVEGPGTPGIVPRDLKIEGIENVALNSFTFGVDTAGLVQANNLFERGGIRQPTDSSAVLPKFERRYDVSCQERRMKGRTGIRWLTDTCALPAERAHDDKEISIGKKRTPELRHRDRIRHGGDHSYGRDLLPTAAGRS